MYVQDISQNQWVGVDARSEPVRRLSAGRLRLDFSNGKIANICFNGRVLISEVYFALRDYNWGTIPFEIQNFVINESADSFKIRFIASHEQGNIKFNWCGKIEGTAQSEIVYSFDGTAQSDFLRNRIGFCVLHPANCAGMRVKIKHSGGSCELAKLPEQIAAHQPFTDIKSITTYPEAKTGIEVIFDGAVFEMEDQRNWTDASFKTYCTPLSLPFPAQVKCGDSVSQSITIKLLSESEAHKENAVTEPRIAFWGEEFSGKEVSLGSCITKPMTARQMDEVRGLRFTHLRYDYFFGKSQDEYTDIAKQLRSLGIKLLLAVHFTDEILIELPILRDMLSKGETELIGIVAYVQGVKVISEELLQKVRMELNDFNIAVGSGTDAFFTQLNREPPAESLMDFVSYSNNPQVHAFDNNSIMSTVEGQRANIESCRRLYPNIPIFISPVTLKMRWNPDATSKDEINAGQIPNDVDARQMSLFAACWFLRSLSTVLESKEVSAATYFELIGKKGIMEDEEPSETYPFPSAAGMLYPIYYAFLSLENLRESMISVEINEKIVAIRLRGREFTRVIICNTTENTVFCKLSDFPAEFKGFLLDEDNVAEAAQRKLNFAHMNRYKSNDINGAISLKRYSIFVAEI